VRTVVSLFGIVGVFMSGLACLTDNPVSLSEGRAFDVGVKSYIYGYPLLEMVKTRDYMTGASGWANAPLNQFGYSDRLPKPSNREVVSLNVDTLYLSAWLDLSGGPMVLHVPDTQGRYYTIQMLDAYTNDFAYVGKRATGTKEGNYVISGPGWNGTVPSGMKEIKTPTDMVWLIGRVFVNNQSDLPAARSLQKQITLTPVGNYTGATGVKSSSAEGVKPSGRVPKSLNFYENLRAALLDNPPPADQAADLREFEKIGLLNCATPYASLDPRVARGLEMAILHAEKQIGDKISSTGEKVNGWTYNLNIGRYGNDYLLRAAVAKYGLGANVPEEALYPAASVDSTGQQLSGKHDYVIHFANGQKPPVNAFWSITLYNQTTKAFEENPINRYAISDRTEEIQYNPDSSLDIHISKQTPAKGTSNWLPSGDEDFYLILRMYQPKPEVLNGKYTIPPIERTK